MSLQDKITADMKAALKGGDKERLQVLRLLIAALKEEQLQKNRDDLEEPEELAVLQKAVKARREAVEQAKDLGRTDIADKESAEITIIQDYLPAMMSPDEIVAKVKDLAAEVGYSGPADKGKFMKAWMSKYKGIAEGRDVQGALGQLG